MVYGRYIVEQALEDGVNSDLYICGMQPLEEFRPCHEIFQCDPSLPCATHVEADLYAMSRPYMAATDYVSDVSLCAICAGTSHDAEGAQVDAELKTIFSMVLPICSTCKRDGVKYVVGRYLPNGQALLKRLDHNRYLIVNVERGS